VPDDAAVAIELETTDAMSVADIEFTLSSLLSVI
jgi:hypothetical protein